MREFWRGVPVIRSLWLDLKSIRVLYNKESSFFNRWASSTPRKAQLILPSTVWSGNKTERATRSEGNPKVLSSVNHLCTNTATKVYTETFILCWLKVYEDSSVYFSWLPDLYLLKRTHPPGKDTGNLLCQVLLCALKEECKNWYAGQKKKKNKNKKKWFGSLSLIFFSPCSPAPPWSTETSRVTKLTFTLICHQWDHLSHTFLSNYRKEVTWKSFVFCPPHHRDCPHRVLWRNLSKDRMALRPRFQRLTRISGKLQVSIPLQPASFNWTRWPKAPYSCKVLIFIYNLQILSGFVCSFVCFFKEIKKDNMVTGGYKPHHLGKSLYKM